MVKLLILLSAFCLIACGRSKVSYKLPVGEPGVAGEAGVAGPSGENGKDGEDGLNGLDGRDGTDCSVVIRNKTYYIVCGENETVIPTRCNNDDDHSSDDDSSDD